ncbi:MAG: hypothetical protein IT342_24900 [Candidatus Melainabacteria bacterium]|nr:hypothetical protein [Candidatus Melainabacteria bacterium]
MAFSLPGFRHDPDAHVVEDIRSNFSGRDPIRDLTNRLGETDPSENIFADVVDRTYGRYGGDRNQWRRTAPIDDGFSIDFSNDRYDRRFGNHQLELHRTSRELMNTLDKHAGGINIGRHKDHITRDELNNYLIRVGDNISPQDKADLLLIMRDFNEITRADGKKGKGISYQDMATFVMLNQREDRMLMMHRQNERLREQNAKLRDELRQLGGDNKRGDTSPSAPSRKDSSKVITERKGDRGNYYAAGDDLPLSQEEFKAHYGIPQNIDLLKFMKGKANDGKVPDFWTSDVAAGLGGRDKNNNLRWDNASHHEPSLDFQRNFAQLAEYFDRLPIEQQEEFTFNFARTQGAVLRAHGVSLLAVDNEKIQITERGTTKYIDLVQDVGSDRKLLQWV